MKNEKNVYVVYLDQCCSCGMGGVVAIFDSEDKAKAFVESQDEPSDFSYDNFNNVVCDF